MQQEYTIILWQSKTKISKIISFEVENITESIRIEEKIKHRLTYRIWKT
jgi:hypothetical protein